MHEAKPSKMAERFAFGSKADTLAQLKGLLTEGEVCEQIAFSVQEWREKPTCMLNAILSRFSQGRLAVRSSASNEDGWHQSMAGAYHSVIGVDPGHAPLHAAVEAVLASYGDHPAAENQVLVQPMVENVALAGVVLTRDLDTGSPYYVINYDDFSGRTDTVTGGAESKCILVHRSRPQAIHSPRIRRLISTIIEIETVVGSAALDVEFCVTRDDRTYILQVRPLAARHAWVEGDDAIVDSSIGTLRNAITQRLMPETGVVGSTTLFSDMTDWNPAEMIGSAPKPLALSLYRTLITDQTWWRARAHMGYRRVEKPLLVRFAGRPYIDIRCSLNSFLPADLPEDLATRLVDHQLGLLRQRPELHDKVEFDVAITCRDFSFATATDGILLSGFSLADIRQLDQALTRLTARALGAGEAEMPALLERTRLPIPKGETGVRRMRQLVASCIDNGTMPFSILARHGFIAMSFLRSLEARGALTPDRADLFLRSIHTVAGELVSMMFALSEGRLELADFLSRYGHLRPGTYDLLSRRYDEQPELYLGHASRAPEELPQFTLSAAEHAATQALLDEAGLAGSPDRLFAYMVSAIAAREEAKFNFSRYVSDLLVEVAVWAESRGLSREDASFLTIDDILAEPDSTIVAHQVAKGREGYRLTRAVRLPQLITEADDVDVVRLPIGHPNFITSKSVTAPTAVVDGGTNSDLEGCVVLIESADPGFDWIFSHHISGLITKNGGANSHMAIRCAEFGLPAAIGCGERLFNSVSLSRAVELNCAARTLKSLN